MWKTTLRLALMMGVFVTSFTQEDDPGALEGTNSKEYCLTETFKASCGPDDVIVMDGALYGRMRIGECAKKSYDSIGCSVDVLPETDRYCSGRHECSFDVDTFHKVHKLQPCPTDLSSYLEANYSCVPVVKPMDQMCNPGQPIELREPQGTIANVITETTGFGSEECPWLIRAKEGQQINITLINFSRVSGTPDNNVHSGHSARRCYQYASIMEHGSRMSITECEGGQRVDRAYLSSSHRLQLSILSRASSNLYFMLKYNVFGCADPVVPQGASKKRIGDTLVVRCNFTDESFTLTCDGQRWSGVLRNCSKVAEDPPKKQKAFFDDDGEFPYGILIVVAIGVALGVFFGGILLTLASIYIKKKKVPTATLR